MAIVVNYDFASFRVGLSLLIIPKRATQELEGLNFTIPCIKEICMDICQWPINIASWNLDPPTSSFTCFLMKCVIYVIFGQ